MSVRGNVFGAGMVALLLGVIGLNVALFDGAARGDAEPKASPPVATAPGWVDVEGGLRRLGVAVEGAVAEVAAKEGDVVESGAVLLRLDDREPRLEAKAADLEVTRAIREGEGVARELARRRSEEKRLQPLVAAESEPMDELRRVRAEIQDLESKVALAELATESAKLKAGIAAEHLRRLEVRAPARGEVLRVLARPGDAAVPGSPVVLFAPQGRRLVRAEIDERMFAAVRAGMRAEVRPEYDETKVYGARVERVARAVGPVVGLPEVRPAAKDDRVVECVLALDTAELLIGQRVLVRILGGE